MITLMTGSRGDDESLKDIIRRAFAQAVLDVPVSVSARPSEDLLEFERDFLGGPLGLSDDIVTGLPRSMMLDWDRWERSCA